METRAIINIIDNLESESMTDALSARQGKVLKEMIDNSSIQLLVGTTEEPIVMETLNTGIYKATGVYKYCVGCENTTTTDEHLLVIIVNRSTEIEITLFAPTGVLRRTKVDSTGIVYNNFIQVREDGIVYNSKNIAVIDNGWTSIVLKSGITAHNSSAFPVRCRKQGNVVYIEGAVKGVTTRTCDIGTLPENYRPIGKRVYYTQARTGGKIDTLQISDNGLIEIMQTTAETYNASDYHFISTSFII